MCVGYRTEYHQPGDEAERFMREGYCDTCLTPASEWAAFDRVGGIEVAGVYDLEGNLVAFRCPGCACADCMAGSP